MAPGQRTSLASGAINESIEALTSRQPVRKSAAKGDQCKTDDTVGGVLREESEIDPAIWRISQRYVIPVNADIGDIDVGFIDKPDTTFNPCGVKGLGEVAMVGVSAAVANAVFHSTGKRVCARPIRIENLL
jgi:hypothetical protein